MQKKIYLSLICASILNAVDLGDINIESSTISDIGTNFNTEASTVNTIDQTTIDNIDPKNINDILESVPGITADVRNSAVEIHVRGIDQQTFMWEDTGVAVVIDGVPVMQNGGKVKFNIDEIESIKVIKGGASYLYGEGALAGAVIITTKRPKNKDEVKLQIEAGSYGYKSGKINIVKATKEYATTVNLNYKDDDSFWKDEGRNWTKSVNGKYRYYLDDVSDVTYGINYTDKFEAGGGSVTGVTNAKEHPEGVPGDWSYIRDYYSTLQKYFVTYNKDMGEKKNLKINTYYYKDNYDYQSSPQDTNGDDLDDSYKNDQNDDLTQYGIKSEIKSKTKKYSYLIGLDLGYKNLDKYVVQLVNVNGWSASYAGESSDSTTTQTTYATYGELKYKLNTQLTAISNLRVDKSSYDYTVDIHDYNGSVWSDTTTIRDDSFTNISYRLGATYKTVSKKILFANISTGFKNPRIQDIYAGDYDSDYSNNTDLKQQTTMTYEAGIRGKTLSSTKYKFSIFVTDTKDIIARNNGTYYGNGSLMFDNVGDARNKGFEMSIKSKPKQKFVYSIAYTYLDAYYTKHNPFKVDLNPTYRDSGEDKTYDIVGNKLPRVPHHKLNLIVKYNFIPKWKLTTNIYAQSKYYADETNLVTMPGYAKVNLKLEYKQTKKLIFFTKINNILDKQYYRTVYLYSDRNGDGKLDAEDASITVDPGRVFYAGFKYTF